MKTALVAIIRDEVDDLLSWMGWHAHLGIDCFILFDDGSSDGTDQILLAAAALHDIRIYQLPSTPGAVDERQKHAYLATLKAVQGEFDWVGFLDSDEYLDLHHHDTVQDFLGEMGPDVGAVGINWCLHGSNGLVLRPAQPIFYAFTRHSCPEEPINRHVKSFVRPSSCETSWLNPHQYPLNKGRYVNPEQETLAWERHGICTRLPNWKTARIRHYQVRSLEQFAQRARRRANLQLRTHDFLVGDRNEVEDLGPRQHLRPVLNWMREVIFQGAAQRLQELPVSTTTSLPHPVQPLPFSLALLVPWNSRLLGVRHDSTVGTLEGEDSTAPQLYALRAPTLPEQVFLLACDATGTLCDFTLLSDKRINGVLPYQLGQSSEGTPTLRHEGFLSAPPVEPLIADRQAALRWENFDFENVEGPSSAINWEQVAFVRFLQEALSLPPTLETLGRFLRKDRRLTLRLLPVFHARLSARDKTQLETLLKPFQSWFFSDLASI